MPVFFRENLLFNVLPIFNQTVALCFNCAALWHVVLRQKDSHLTDWSHTGRCDSSPFMSVQVKIHHLCYYSSFNQSLPVMLICINKNDEFWV